MKNSLTESQKGLTKEQQLRALREAKFKKSDGVVESRHDLNCRPEYPASDMRSEAVKNGQDGLPLQAEGPLAGVAPGPSEPIRKRGRPLAGETRT